MRVMISMKSAGSILLEEVKKLIINNKLNAYTTPEAEGRRIKRFSLLKEVPLEYKFTSVTSSENKIAFKYDK